MLDLSKIPDYILDDARRNVPMMGDKEEFTDEELQNKTKAEIFEHYLQWQGIIGFGDDILHVVEDLFEVNLDLSEY